MDEQGTALCCPCEYDSDDVLSDEDSNHYMINTLGSRIQVYPIDLDKVARAQPGGTPMGQDSRAPKEFSKCPCPGCRGTRPKNDWAHTRVIGECKYPYDEPWIPDCPACQDRKPRDNPAHTYNEGCRWTTIERRSYHPRKSSKRPHEPRPRKDDDPTARLSANRDGRELGADAEEEVAREDRERAASGGEPGNREITNTDSSTASSSTSPPTASQSGRGPDREQRERRTYRDEGTSTESPADWTNFDIGRCVRIFRTNRDTAIKHTLRKLHVRWWHASELTMRRFLERVGVADKVLDMLPDVVHSCPVCREWARPGPANVSSTELADNFNQQVECDLLFVHK